jgi:acyl-coenzyme A synthetase/AMP-(fatty) acid ligase
VDETGRHTYEELACDSATVAAMILEHGIGKGDVISIQLPNRYETVVVAVAAQAVGAVINPLLPNYRAHELNHVFRTARPKMVFTPAVYRDWDHRPMIDGLRASSGVSPVHVVVDDEPGGDVHLPDILAGAPAAGRPEQPAPAADVSEIIFTSGTESTPKAVMHTEETTNFAVRVAFSDLGVGPDAVVWMPSPVGHSTGFNYGIRAALYHGRTLVLQDRWDPSHAVELIQEHACTYTLAATTFLDDLVDGCERGGARLPQMTHFGCGGAPVPASGGQATSVFKCCGCTDRPKCCARPGTGRTRRSRSGPIPTVGCSATRRSRSGAMTAECSTRPARANCMSADPTRVLVSLRIQNARRRRIFPVDGSARATWSTSTATAI